MSSGDKQLRYLTYALAAYVDFKAAFQINAY